MTALKWKLFTQVITVAQRVIVCIVINIFLLDRCVERGWSDWHTGQVYEWWI